MFTVMFSNRQQWNDWCGQFIEKELMLVELPRNDVDAKLHGLMTGESYGRMVYGLWRGEEGIREQGVQRRIGLPLFAMGM